MEQSETRHVEEERSVHTIRDGALYFGSDVKRILRLRDSTLRREIRLGRLRVSKRAGRYFFMGRWLREWIEGGELIRGCRIKSSSDDGAVAA